MTQKPNSSTPSPFGGGSSRPSSNLPGSNRPGSLPPPPKPPAPPANQSRSSFTPGSLGSRFGPARTAWEILPFAGTVARFSLDGLGGSLQRIFGGDSAAGSVGTYDALLQSIEKNREAMKTLAASLNAAWDAYQLAGAILVYPWEQDTRHVILAHAKVSSVKAMCLRSLDPLLVLNVLARSRTNLLQPRAPLALEPSYLGRTLISDDVRLVKLVQCSGYFEEIIPEEVNTDEELEE